MKRLISGESRGNMYEASGAVLLHAAREIGLDIDNSDGNQWVSTMRNLALADELSEAKDLSSKKVLDILEISESPHLLSSAGSLLDASARARRTTNLTYHLDARGDEAFYTLELLRYQTREAFKGPSMWRQMAHAAQAGIYLDSAFDANEDSAFLPFSTFELAMASTNRFVLSGAALELKTRIAILKGMRTEGMDIYLATKPIRALRQLASKAVAHSSR